MIIEEIRFLWYSKNFGLMSHRNVLGNIEYGLEIKGISKEERTKKAKDMLSMVGLEGYKMNPLL